ASLSRPPPYTLSLHDALPICQLEQLGRVLVLLQCGELLLGLGQALLQRFLLLPEACFGVALQRLDHHERAAVAATRTHADQRVGDRKSTRLNSSHVKISYAVF